MNELLTDQLLTSVISLLTIFVNVRVAKYNISKSNKIKSYDQHKEALIKYYLPIKFSLIKLDYVLRDSNNTYFDVFELYKTDVQKANKRVEIVKVYREFMNIFNTLPLYFTNDTIDKSLTEVYEHVLLILMWEQNNVNVSQYKEKHAMPNLQEIIKSINNYSISHESFDKQGILHKIKRKLKMFY